MFPDCSRVFRHVLTLLSVLCFVPSLLLAQDELSSSVILDTSLISETGDSGPLIVCPRGVTDATANSCARTPQERARINELRRYNQRSSRTIVTLRSPSLVEFLENADLEALREARSVVRAHALALRTRTLTSPLASQATTARGIFDGVQIKARSHGVRLQQEDGAIIGSLARRGITVSGHHTLGLHSMVVDREISLEELETLYPATFASAYPDVTVLVSLKESIDLVNAPQAWQLRDNEGGAIKGKGVTIGIIDTGIDYTHQDFGSCARTADITDASCPKLVGGYDFINKDSDPFDDHGHGTHCASIAAGNGALKGVAPEASLYAYKVLSKNGSGSTSGIIAAVERSIDPNGDGDISDHLDVISLSLGSYGGDPDAPLSLALDRAARAGIVPVVAAGNDGPESRSISNPGSSRLAITVGATSKYHELASFSSRGPIVQSRNNKLLTAIKPDVIAPGQYICAAKSPPSSAYSTAQCNNNDLYTRKSGTSMATPHIAGGAALVVQAHPTWSPQQVKTAIKNSARISSPLRATLSYLETGMGEVDTVKAIQSIGLGVALHDAITVNDTLTLKGFVQPGATYALSIAPYALHKDLTASSWTTIFQGESSGISDGSFEKTIPVNSYKQGRYFVKLIGYNSAGAQVEDIGIFEILRFGFDEPTSFQTVNPGEPIPFKIIVPNGYQIDTLTLEASYDNNIYKPVTMMAGGSVGEGSFVLTKDKKSTVSLRAVIQHHGIVDTIGIHDVVVDPTLKKGFPLHVPFAKRADGVSFESYDQTYPIAADIDRDGKSGIVIYREGIDNEYDEFLIYTHDGKPLRNFAIGPHRQKQTKQSQRYRATLPVVTDLDGDGELEFVAARNYFTYSSVTNTIKHDSVLMVLDQYGATRKGFPQYIAHPVETIMTADLDRDGLKEIILSSENDTVDIYSSDGVNTGAASLYFPPEGRAQLSSVDGGRLPVVGNFDNDTDLEVAAFSQVYLDGFKFILQIMIIDKDFKGTVLPLHTLSGFSYGSPVAFDYDSDGVTDIVFTLVTGKSYVYVFSPTKGILPGFPIGHSLSCYSVTDLCGTFSGALSVGTLAGDTTPSVVLPLRNSFGHFSSYKLTQQGNLLHATVPIFGGSPIGQMLIADVTGDAVSDLLIENADIFRVKHGSRGVFMFPSETSYQTSVLTNTEGSFQDYRPYAHAVVDLDNDGTRELLMASSLERYIDAPFYNKTYKDRFTIYLFETLGKGAPRLHEWMSWRGGNDYNGCSRCPTSAIRSRAVRPNIIEQPVSLTAPEKTVALFSVRSDDSNVAYQWYFSHPQHGLVPLQNETRSSLALVANSENVGVYSVAVIRNGMATFSQEVTLSLLDLCPLDSQKISPGVCGCGTVDRDSNNNKIVDCMEISVVTPPVATAVSNPNVSRSSDSCPDDPSKTTPGECGCGVPDLDINGNLIKDCLESKPLDMCPYDPNKIAPGVCGCYQPDSDDNRNGVTDCLERASLKTLSGAIVTKIKGRRRYQVALQQLSAALRYTVTLRPLGSKKGRVDITARSRKPILVIRNLAMGRWQVSWKVSTSLNDMKTASAPPVSIRVR
jgi:hypothetical protein